jgi:hypothetical protein
VPQDKFYDQIAVYKHKIGVENTAAGIFNFYDHVFNDQAVFAGTTIVPDGAKFTDWRTYQMSDHLIMWCEFSVDHTDAYLKSLGGSVG